MERKYKPKPKIGHRYFVALMPDKETRTRIRDIQRGLQSFAYKLQFTNLEQMHFTLKFLGNAVSEGTADAFFSTLEANVKDQAMTEFQLKADDLEFGFGNEAIPNIIHLRTTDSDGVNGLVDLIQDILWDLPYEDIIKRRENPRFLGHITIARVRKDISKSHVRQIREKLKILFPGEFTFTASSIYLIESMLTKHGPIYKIQREIPLKTIPQDLKTQPSPTDVTVEN